jgi:hypothetical protein
MALKDWEKSQVYYYRWYHKREGDTIKIEKMSSLFYVRVYNNHNILIDSLAEGSINAAIKAVKRYMRSH